MARSLRCSCLIPALLLLAPLAGRAHQLNGVDTYAALDAEAYRVKTVFTSGAYAVAEVFNDDEIHSRLYSREDVLLGEIILSKHEKTLRADFPNLASVKAGLAEAAGLKTSKDWANLQAYSLWMDLSTTKTTRTAPVSLSWQGQEIGRAHV